MFEDQQIALGSFENLRRSLKEWIENPTYEEDDVRNMFLNQLDKILLFHDLNSYYFIKILQNKTQFDNILQTASIVDYYKVLETYQVQGKNALIFQLSSILERFFRVLLLHIKPEATNKQFYAIREELFKLLDFEKDDEWKAISILSNIRNTFHNNGIHTSDDVPPIIYKNINYEFIKNKAHNCANYYTLFMITQDIVKLYQKICKHHLINSFPMIKG
ncbi:MULTISPECIES: hypothetical protein [Chryseobacterium]|uniref:hypothetical protein n=1 Tax=Chryseobacterium TaxID=59732 RepID=UPI0024202F42|nr:MULTISPECIES: hypothetical protein [Chryseobacterium]